MGGVSFNPLMLAVVHMLFQSCCEFGSLSLIDLCNSDITALFNCSTGGYRGVIEGRGGEGMGEKSKWRKSERRGGDEVKGGNGGEETRGKDSGRGRGEANGRRDSYSHSI